jgi:hypothetical protein
MEGAALIVQIERAVMVVGIGTRDSRSDMRVAMSGDWHRLIHIQRVVVDQRDDPRNLRDHEERQQGCAEAADCSHERHRALIAPASF